MLWLLLKPGAEHQHHYFFKDEDKLAHFGIFAVWAVVGGFYLLYNFKWRFAQVASVIILGGIFLAIGTEMVQHFVPRRTADVSDALADTFGALSGVFFVFLSKKAMFNVDKKIDS
jgi:VanZ family protein